MQDYVILVSLDDECEESSFIKKGSSIIEAFDYMGKLWPLHIGKKYKVNLELQQLDPQDPELISKTDGKLENINNTYQYYLYGYVKDNIFYVGDFKFDFEEFNDYNQYDNKYIKFVSDRINVEFLEEVSSRE